MQKNTNSKLRKEFTQTAVSISWSRREVENVAIYKCRVKDGCYAVYIKSEKNWVDVNRGQGRSYQDFRMAVLFKIINK